MIRQGGGIIFLSRNIYRLRGIRQNNNYSSSMAQEGYDENDEYDVTIQTRLGRIIVDKNRFGKATAIELGLLSFQ